MNRPSECVAYASHLVTLNNSFLYYDLIILNKVKLFSLIAAKGDRKMEISIPMDEQETTVNMYPRSVDEKAYIYTSIPSVEKRLKKFSEQYEEVILEKQDYNGSFFTVPLKWITIKPPRKSNMTEEQKQAARERLMAARANKQ